MVHIEYDNTFGIGALRLKGALRKTGVHKLNKVSFMSDKKQNMLIDFSEVRMDLSIRDLYVFIDQLIKKIELLQVENIALVSKSPFETVLTVLLEEKLSQKQINSRVFFESKNATQWLGIFMHKLYNDVVGF